MSNNEKKLHITRSMHGVGNLQQQKVEIAGIEPATLCMLSTRAANCAKSPFCYGARLWHLSIPLSAKLASLDTTLLVEDGKIAERRSSSFFLRVLFLRTPKNVGYPLVFSNVLRVMFAPVFFGKFGNSCARPVEIFKFQMRS